MLILSTEAEVRRWRDQLRPGVLGLVPTMGALHAGHMALVERARGDCATVIASIFVNPTQFGPREDLSLYPRDEKRDLAMLRAAGVDAVFMPEVAEIYPHGAETIVETTKLSRILMGRLRPGHFRGVATVVAKLFNIIRPDAAYFGEKDYQQLLVIRRMVADLNMGLRIEAVPTMRAPDGLALSSRNARLSKAERRAAPVLSRALDAAEVQASVADMRAVIRDTLTTEPLADVQSIDIRDAATLNPVRGRPTAPVVALLAVRFGSVLLIDQRVIDVTKRRPG